MSTQALGKWGEERAAAYLRDLGHSIVCAGYRTRFGEIDLIAAKDGFLSFVEVKLRRDARFAAAREFVDARKQQKLRICASQYLAEFPSALQPRFDVIEIYAPQGMNTKLPKITYIENAFE